MNNKKNSLLSWYKDKFVLDEDSSNELAQKNYNLYVYFIPILFLFSAGNIIPCFIIHFHNLQDVLPRLIYYGIFLVLTIAMLIYCKIVKNCDRSKNYILKNIPFYVTGIITYCLSVYNFYVFDTYVNGIIIYEIISIIALLLYDYEPLLFFFSNIFPFCLMIPPFLAKFGISTVADILVFNTVICIFSFNKRRLLKKNQLLVNKQKQNIKLITFGNFTILYNQTVVTFQRKKSLELLAYLVYKKGSNVNSKELMCVLWGDRADSSTYGSSLRNLIVDIKQTLKKLNIMDFFVAEYNSFRINPSVVNCDYYNFLSGIRDEQNVFSGEFMSQFSWAEDTTAYLESINKQ